MTDSKNDIETAVNMISRSDAPITTASTMISVGIDSLARIGGREAAASVLVEQLKRIHEGKMPDTMYSAGHA